MHLWKKYTIRALIRITSTMILCQFDVMNEMKMHVGDEGRIRFLIFHFIFHTRVGTQKLFSLYFKLRDLKMYVVCRPQEPKNVTKF